MRSKLSWITFIPFTLAASPLMVMNVLGIHETGNVLPYVASGVLLLMFIINIVFCVIDKKTSPAYLLSRNVPLAVVSVIAAGLITSRSALTIIIPLREGNFNALYLALSTFGFLCAMCLIFCAVSHLQGRNFLPRMGLAFLAMSIWGGLTLINQFLDNRYVSVVQIDPMRLFCVCFIMIYFFKLPMIISTVEGKNPVKAMYLYGFSAASFGIAIGVRTIMNIIVNGLDYSEDVLSFSLMAIGIYAILFNVEITRFSRTNEEQILVYDLDDFDENQRVYGAAEDSLVVTPETQTGDYDYDYTSATIEAEEYVTAADKAYTSDYEYEYGYGYGDEEDGDDLVVAPETTYKDDAIYVEKDVVESFEEGVVDANAEVRKTNSDGEVIRTAEEQAKIDSLFDNINSSGN